MANPEHLAILKQGVQTWNRWRKASSVVPDFSTTSLSGMNLRSADLTFGNLFLTRMQHVDLSEADLSCASFVAADLTGATLTRARLNSCDFGHSKLDGATLCEADCGRAEFGLASLRGCSLIRTRLNGARFYETDLYGADLSGAHIGYTVFCDVDLSTVKGLTAIVHDRASGLSFRTLSHHQLPLSFLRGCGLPDQVIDYHPNLAGKASRFCSCFISYSMKDRSFSELVHAGLQREGTRCWFAPEDLKIGDPFRQRIDESIRLHDKLVLILSEHSVNSQWVQDEVEALLERERRENRLVLFPIRIDSAVVDADKPWAASIRRTRHIGDFSNWQKPASYQQAFQRLLRDLKAEGEGSGH